MATASVRTITAQEIRCGLAWDLTGGRGGKAVDLDASAVAFSEDGEFIDTSYFANLEPQPLMGALRHMGDSRDGSASGDDETIIAYLELMPDNVKYLYFLITTYTGEKFFSVETATVRIYDSKKTKILEYSPSLQFRQANSIVLCRITRQSSSSDLWDVTSLALPGEGRCFAEVITSLQSDLRQFIPDLVIRPMESYVLLTKGEVSKIPNSSSLFIGLGWDFVNEAIDLDASVVAFNYSCQAREMVFFNRLEAFEGLIRHSGDNTTGEGEGDDERVFLKLNDLPGEVRSLSICVTSYEGHPFNRIQNAKVRLVEVNEGNSREVEMLRFPISQMGPSTGLIMCSLFRSGNNDDWFMKADAIFYDLDFWNLKNVTTDVINEM